MTQIIFFLSHYLFGIIEDNVSLLVYPNILTNWTDNKILLSGYPFGQTILLFRDNQPIFQMLFYLMSSWLDTVLVFNLLVIITLVVTFYVSYVTFKLFLKSPLVSSILSITFLFSGYVSYQIRSHLDLAQIWVFPAFLLILLKKEFKYKYVVLGLFLSFVVAISNYLGFFMLLFLLIYIFVNEFLLFYLFGIRYRAKSIFRNYLCLFAVFTVLTGSFLFPYIRAQYVETSHEDNRGPNPKITRTLEDFSIFTSRPWYYLLPSTDNPFYGTLAKNAIYYLQNKWGYYLAQNYFKEEHSATYLGYVNIVLLLFGVLAIYKNIQSKLLKKDHYLNVMSVGIVGIVFIILTMPPIISISGFSIYMPSYILWRFFPMFRTLTRLGGFISFIALIYTGFGYLFLLNKINSILCNTHVLIRTLVRYFLVTLIFLLGLSEFYIPIKIYDLSRIPGVFVYLEKNTSANSPIVVYPYSKTNWALLWLKYYKRPLINPRSFTYNSNNISFVSEDFTSKLNTCQGLITAESLGMNYLIVFYNTISVEDRKMFEFWENNSMLTKITTYQEQSAPLLNKGLGKYLKVIGTDSSDSASIYRINKPVNDFCSEPS